MKIAKNLMIALLISAAFAACKKDDGPGVKSIEGVWVGKWGDGSDEPSYYYKLQVKKGGELVRWDEDGDVIATGTWSLDGINFEGSYTMNNGYSFSVKALFSDIAGELTGTWGEGDSYANGGTFDLKKQ
ncbi:MAG: hypothetical protein H6562_09945 [Lewinellaceae bacterium]|nr:hypothetical protein [Lewinella sp.]MCB9279226.1 hypothetical protein [Lewinellaceae bacterium]